MSIELLNRVKVLERQRAEDFKRIEQLEAQVKELGPKPIGRPRKHPTEKPDGK